MQALTKLAKVQTIIFDVDGVFTNSDLLVTESGEMLRKMNTRDGYAIKKAIENGIQIIIITGGTSQGVVKRLEGLGIERIYFGIKDKILILESLVKNNVIDLATTAYMGDDLPDIDCLKKVFFASCPKDAAEEVVAICDYVSHVNGGQGAVRDFVSKVLKLKGQWN